MALSNTATPIYYGQFRDAVLRGEIPVCKEIAYEMNRIDELIANPNYYYDPNGINGFIKFCENELTLTDGTDLRLLDSFKLWAESIFGWYYYVERSIYVPTPDNHGGSYVTKLVKKRLVTKQYLIVARGAAKSMYASCLQAYFLNIDTSTSDQITTAPTMKQADEVMSPIRTAITRARGPLFKFLTEGSMQNTTGSRANRVKLASTKKGIENFLTGSKLEIRPMNIDKLQGLRPKVSTVDEWLSGDIREDVVGAIEQGATKLDDWLIIAISSEGTVRNGSGDTIKMELAKILKGEYYNPHVSIWHYKLDNVEEVNDPRMWPKAQPNLDKTVTRETYHLDVERMEQAPASRNDILAKRFGIPMEGYTYFFTYEETEPHRQHSFRKMPCAMGADLSQGDDFCAFTFLFPLREVLITPNAEGMTHSRSFGVKTRSYITSLTLMKLPGAMRMKYDQFIKEGSLIVLEGTVLDMMDVYQDLDEHIIRMDYDVRAFGYDPYNASEFVDRWSKENGPFGIQKVIQGARTESVPLGELKILSEQRLLIFDELLMQFAMGNAITLEDTNGNRKLLKKRNEQKIDNVSAMMDGYIAYKAFKDVFE
ncbi:terminase large subunit [Arthrobacter phage Qui]|uniref:Terminase n=1 Tax=Arthrobacter phage Qui TaxID=2603260 RepID=A0A5B8WIB8_9CAUD|nr:terminase large subunit [Arthrobacter phage Qui]QED11507.1 terminase [Arthrobacter phage Qui]QOC56338.1 terminase [Arthrobacter phage Paella]